MSNIHAYSTGIRNYGINEAIALDIGLKYFKFDPDDLIIKFNARYTLKNDEFIRLAINNQEFDAIVFNMTHGRKYTALFALKLKYLLDFLDNRINFETMKKDRPFECEFFDYIEYLSKKMQKSCIFLKFIIIYPLGNIKTGVRSPLTSSYR